MANHTKNKALLIGVLAFVLFLFLLEKTLVLDSFKNALKAIIFFNSYLLLIIHACLAFYAIHKLTNSNWIQCFTPFIKHIPFYFYVLTSIFLCATLIQISMNIQSIEFIGLLKKLLANLVLYAVSSIVIGIKKQSNTKTYYVLVVFALFLNSFWFTETLVSDLYPNFHSTLFSWYLVISFLLSGYALLFLQLLFTTKDQAIPHQLKIDLGRYLFSFSCIWFYFWFSQFLLIWYGNIPHETLFYKMQLNYSSLLFYTSIVLSFIVPFLLLLLKTAKTNSTLLKYSAIAILIGQSMIINLLFSSGSPQSSPLHTLSDSVLLLSYFAFVLVFSLPQILTNTKRSKQKRDDLPRIHKG